MIENINDFSKNVSPILEENITRRPSNIEPIHASNAVKV